MQTQMISQARNFQPSIKMRNKSDVVSGMLFRQGRILLTQRAVSKPYPALWEFPGGKVEIGESHAEALSREFAEETGLFVKCTNSTPFHIQTVGEHTVHLYVVETQLAGQNPVIVDECAMGLGWFDSNELIGLRLMPSMNISRITHEMHRLLERSQLWN